MSNKLEKWRLLTLITDADKRDRVEQIMDKHAPLAYFSVRGKGTTSRSWLRQLGIRESAKTQFEFLLTETKEAELMQAFADGLHLGQPGHGITFSTTVLFHLSAFSKLNREELQNFCQSICAVPPEENTMYKKVTVIVDLGLGDDVIEVARDAGAKGGTILHGQGSATSEHEHIFGINIVPEKEMVIMLMQNEIVEQVVSAINDRFKLDGMGNGILYIEAIESTRGLVEYHIKSW